jgi:predicted lipoprotein with Yx(FWY)xxD motif
MALPLLLLAPVLGAHAARPAAHAHATVQVTIQNFAFSPQTITVAPGTTVTWTNKDSVNHTVTSDTDAWPDSGNLATNRTFSHTFANTGTYTYHCALHPSMTAKVIVSAARPAVALVKTAAARVLVNAQGRTLYVFTSDKPSKSVCYSQCAKAWPPLLVPKGTRVPAAMSGIKGKFGVAVRTGGAPQLTYDGAPLYLWFKDKKPGDITGQGVGGTWWIVVAPRRGALRVGMGRSPHPGPVLRADVYGSPAPSVARNAATSRLKTSERRTV